MISLDEEPYIVLEALLNYPTSFGEIKGFSFSTPVQLCPRCGHLMPAIKGSKASVCQVCGYKDDCC